MSMQSNKDKEILSCFMRKLANCLSREEQGSMKQVETLTGYPFIDRPWLKYYSEEAIKVQVPECSVYENVYLHNKMHKNDVAILCFGKKITYRKLFHEVDKIVKALISYGVEESDNVVLCTPAIPEARLAGQESLCHK